MVEKQWMLNFTQTAMEGVFLKQSVPVVATVCQVYRQAEGALHRPMVIIAGTNNILKKSTEEIYSNLERNLQSLTKERTVHVTTIPNRYDTNPIDPTHHDINIANNYIKEIAVRMDNVHIIDLDEFGRDHFTRHGLHLNYRGKKKLSYMIIDSLEKTFKYHKGKKHLNTEIELPSQSSTIKPYSINIIEADMKKIIRQHQNDPTIAFAHAISNDLDHERNMSAGVAVVFRESFGRPQTSDFVDTKLTCQTLKSGATVYSLVTKENYNGKPTQQSYNEAFEQLIKDFKKKQLKTLYCSPMGCVRDLIRLENLCENITRLQQTTGATVCVTSYDQPSARRKLWHGLTHTEFLEKLRQVMNDSRSKAAAQTTTTVNSPSVSPIRLRPTQLGDNADTTQSPVSLRVVPGSQEYRSTLKNNSVTLFLTVGEDEGNLLLAGNEKFLEHVGPLVCTIMSGRGQHRADKYRARVLMSGRKNAFKAFSEAFASFQSAADQ
ncbi:hypothetical protein J6590_083349 [Homalodisca vitripennis]|nr:hypothetical protein J6590_083349 [Homalodisca vitripennis]